MGWQPARWFEHSLFLHCDQAALNVRTKMITSSLLALSLLRGGAAPNAPFSIQERAGITWLAKPDGERFFSLGVCVVNPGAGREQFSLTNPGYAAFQHYDNSNRWAEATLRRLKS